MLARKKSNELKMKMIKLLPFDAAALVFPISFFFVFCLVWYSARVSLNGRITLLHDLLVSICLV